MTRVLAAELAYYYPNPVWRSGDWIKNLLLFFDGIALLVPHYMRNKPFAADPAIAIGLQDKGLLTILEPETFLNKEATQRLADAMMDILNSGVLDNLEQGEFHEISWSRMGGYADEELAGSIFEELKRRGLAQNSEDGVSIPIHSTVRYLILLLLSQILRKTGEGQGLNLQPATDRSDILQSLQLLLRYPTMPSAGHVVSLDIETVGVDLSAIPLDEVLDFRAAHKNEYQAYARDLRRFVREVSGLDSNDQLEALRDRQAEIKTRAADLNRTAKQAWSRAGSLTLGLAGAAWRFHSGDVLGGLFAAGAGILGAGSQAKSAEAYSYLFQARRVLA